MDTGNPFAAHAAFDTNQMNANPFLDASTMPTESSFVASDPWGSPNIPKTTNVVETSNGFNPVPFPAPESNHQPPPSFGNNFSQNPYAPQPFVGQQSPANQIMTQTSAPIYQPPQPQMNPFDSFAAAPVNSLVVSQNQSNPYTQQPSLHGNAMVVSQYQYNPFSNMAPNQQQSSAPNPVHYGEIASQQQHASNQLYSAVNPVARVNPFDPFAMSAPAPPPPPQSFGMDPFQQPTMENENRTRNFSAESMPCFPNAQPPIMQHRGSFDASRSVPPQMEPELPKTPPPQNSTARASSREVERTSAAVPRTEEEPKSLFPPTYDYGHRPDLPPDRDVRTNESPRNKYSMELARRAPPGASPLPKADLVRKRGFVLSRISFRTIVLKKWKQSFWIQYGPHTMLWFRSQSDFDDWLNNPYHSQTERNFLIKLAVNFVHDLYKPNVRGYQVTQCRTKGYGSKLVRQFKLERWMDYGPTIAAAFGSYDPKEVDSLREALVECMRNTPLSGGIRATGAVRQRPPEETQRQRSHSHGSSDSGSSAGRPKAGGYRRDSYENLPKEEQKEKPIEPPKEVDLMDLNGWDGPTESSNTVASPIALVSNGMPQNVGYGQPQQQFLQAQQPGFHQGQYPVAQQYDNALVPAGQPQAYPGAPPHVQNTNAANPFGVPLPTPSQQFVGQQGWNHPTAGQPVQPYQYPQQQQQQQPHDPWMQQQAPRATPQF